MKVAANQSNIGKMESKAETLANHRAKKLLLSILKEFPIQKKNKFDFLHHAENVMKIAS